jgi:adenylate cyclase class 2
MKHRHETEIKLAVREAKEVRKHLSELGFRTVLGRHFESNYVFDFPDQRLRKSRCMIRIRFAGNRGVVTYKGAPLRSQDYKIRPEIETKVQDGHQLREILLHLGLQEVFCYEKFRTMFAPRGKGDATHAPHLVIDETPIGNYLELEGPQRWIDEVARQLGYTRKDYIRESYASLYRKKCQVEGTTPGNMVFPSRES